MRRMAGPDGLAELRRHGAARQAADVEDEFSLLEGTIGPERRAELARGIAGKLDAHILARPKLERRRGRQHDLGDLWRELVDLGDGARPLHQYRQFFEFDLRIACDRGLAGEHSAAMARAAVIDRARNDRHAAALTLSRSAVVWNEDQAAEHRVDQVFAGAGFDELAVDDEPTRPLHREASRRCEFLRAGRCSPSQNAMRG